MTNEEAAAMLESMKDYFLPTSPMLEERREEITAIDLAISTLSKQSSSSEQANDTDRPTEDQCGDGSRMIDLKKRTITERLIIANSLIASAIADLDNNQFPEGTKKTDDVPDTNVGELISRLEIEAYIMKCPYFAGKNTIDRSNIGTHIGSCDLEHHYRKVCPSNECLCAERLGLKNG